MLLLPGTSLAKSAAASAPDAISAAHWAPEALSTNPSVSSFFASKASPTPPAAARKLCQKPNGSSAVAKKVEVIVKEMSLRLREARDEQTEAAKASSPLLFLLLLSLFQLTAPVPAERRRFSGVVCGVEGEKPSA